MTATTPMLSPRRVWVTVGYVLAAIGLSFVPGIGIEWFAAPRSLVVIGGIVTAVALGALHLFRGRWPTVVVVAGLAVMVFEALLTGTTSVGATLIECDAIYSLVIARSTAQSQRLLPMIAAACLSVAVAGLLLANILSAPLLQATILLFAVGVTLWWGITVRAPMTRADQERERASLVAEAAAARQREALVAERLQISRELHDTISGHLSAITIQSAAAVAASTPLTAEELTARLSCVRALSLDAMGDMRTLIEVLRTDTSTPVTLPQNWSAIGPLIGHARESGTSLTLTGDDPATIPVDSLASVTAYNAVREALTNAAKHAPGMRVAVDIRSQGEHLDIAIANDRRPHAETGAVSSGYGLIGLAERVRLCGGDLHIDRSDDTWTLRVRLPLTAGREAQHA
ncbi:MAG: histidine kinase [Nocardioidaceae bacterium]|nr:histidine kinase [Janibacter sp.]MDN5745512.1 histidine kinase [Nocardioidaceae bacterium]